MENGSIERLKSVKDFESLVSYLKNELLWPIEVEDAEEITFNYSPADLGIEERYAAKIKSLKQIRPLADDQPWGIFYVEFEPKKLPVVVLRRILRAMIHSRRRTDERTKVWRLSDLIFISSLGEIEDRKISFAQFSEREGGLPELRTFSWDPSDTYFHYQQSKMDLGKLRWPEDERNAREWQVRWSSAFTRRHREIVNTSHQLAVEMARLAAQIRDQVKSVFLFEVSNGPLHTLFGNFREVLIHDLDLDTFADMYAQTMAYGLFSARATQEGEFAVADIAAMIPKTNPFLRNLFRECSLIGETHLDSLDLDELGITELVTMLKESKIEAVLQDFGKRRKGEDPVIHFYELFLKEYDPKQKVKRGIFYTPDSVVSFIVKSVDYLLRNQFDCPDGLADTSPNQIELEEPKTKNVRLGKNADTVPVVQVLDPATGTGTFLKHAVEEIRRTFLRKHQGLDEEELREEWNEYVPKHILPRLFGFELMMAPYSVAHLKLGLELAETGYNFESEERLGIYLTNTLEGTHAGTGTLDAYFNWLAEEGYKANVIKSAKTITVVFGNPPYAGHSANKSKWIADLLRGRVAEGARKSNYFEIDGKPLGEKNPKWLNDDYVKFLRFGQWRIDKTGQGVLAFVTNHAYLDNPTFRGMRQQLMESFTDIYILDLHGNAKKKERCPDGGKDENVFDIQQGVAIGIFVKNPRRTGPAKIHHSDLWGLRELKYKTLLEEELETLEWDVLKPSSPFYLFKPQNIELRAEFEKGWSLSDIMPTNSVGIVTARDKLTIQDSPEDVWETVVDFVSLSENAARDKYDLGQDVMDWTVKNAQEDLRSTGPTRDLITPILYRPFDIRFTYNTGRSRGFICRPRTGVMRHMQRANLGLISVRQVAEGDFNHVFVTDTITESRITLSNKGIAYIFPLYLYSGLDGPGRKKRGEDSEKREPNLNADVLRTFSETYKDDVSPEQVLHYIYAILHSEEYRSRYSEFLRIETPRIPLTKDRNLFIDLVKFGEDLVSFHLMKTDGLDSPITTFEGEGDNEVQTTGKSQFRGGRLCINRRQYFGGVPQDVYEFRIGGYQVCQKWLKGRKGQRLTDQEIEHFHKMVVAIGETIRTMKKIDTAIDKNGGWPIE